MSNAFYGTFERHNAGEGLKGHSTHYCAGCGHGLAHKYLAEALAELGVQDNTVTINPVGCAAFLYFYMDTGNTSTAHGRSPATAIGHKVANPDAMVVCYQGDGDLAAIGLAETISTAQLGIPITVIFINNAVYGMTGGQMAPTTLMGQTTTTSPEGRDRFNGTPIRMAEMIAQLDGPAYVERVALFSPAERKKTKKAIKKALQLQQERRGYAFIEVLAECPTHLKTSPEKAMQWVKEEMLPIFPLGVLKDTCPEPWFELPKPSFRPEDFLQAVGASAEKPATHCKGFPTHIQPTDISLKLAGTGGDGAQTIAMLLAKAAINEGFDGTHIPAYGPESRGGTSYADVHVAREEVHNPASPQPDILVAFNAPSLAKFGHTVRPGGVIVYDSAVAKSVKAPDPSIRVVGVPFTDIAARLGKMVVKNIVALGALQAATQLFPEETLLGALRDMLKDKAKLIPLNEQAFKAGVEAAKASMGY
nr:2-oxoacid:acceptor oxidoreductase family protein [uncultured Holophaga sp.]